MWGFSEVLLQLYYILLYYCQATLFTMKAACYSKVLRVQELKGNYPAFSVLIQLLVLRCVYILYKDVVGQRQRQRNLKPRSHFMKLPTTCWDTVSPHRGDNMKRRDLHRWSLTSECRIWRGRWGRCSDAATTAPSYSSSACRVAPSHRSRCCSSRCSEWFWSRTTPVQWDQGWGQK